MDFLIEFDYNAEETDELNLKKGDIVNNCKPYEDGWMSGTFKGKNGVFPSNFGKQILSENNKLPADNTDAVNVEEKVKVDSKPDDNATQPVKKMFGVGFGNIFQGKQIQLKRVGAGDSKAQTGENGAKTEICFDKTSSENTSSKVELVKVTVAYEPANSEELQLEEGDIITVIDKKNTDDGLWRGKLNGKVGLFSFNFVVACNAADDTQTKPPRPNVTVKVGPPPLLTAKPNKTKPMAPRPQSYETNLMVNKPVERTDDEGAGEIGFDTPISHKPLVGPTADRVRRQNVRTPKKIGSQNNNEDVKLSVKEKSMTLPLKGKLHDIDPEDKSSPPKLKAPIQIEEVASSNMKTEKDNHDNSKSSDTKIEATVSEAKKTGPVIRGSSINTTNSVLKGNNSRPKSQFVNSEFSRDNEQPKMSNNDDWTKKILLFESRISELEKENKAMKKELNETMKANAGQITELSTTVHRLLEEVTDEKKKRAVTEEELLQLKRTVERLEQSVG